MNITEAAAMLEEAKMKAERLHCQWKYDKQNVRLLFRTVRAMRACRRIKEDMERILS